MKRKFVMLLVTGFQILSTSSAFAQAFGEYGRAVGAIPQGVGPRTSGNPSPGGVVMGGVGHTGGKALPVRLVVAVKEANLHPKQDEESETVAQLAQGDTLVPLVQTDGGNDWYLVKTSKGVIGWVKSGDVTEQKAKK